MNKKTNTRLVGPSMFLRNKMGDKGDYKKLSNTNSANTKRESFFNSNEQVQRLRPTNSAQMKSNGDTNNGKSSQAFQISGKPLKLNEIYQKSLKSKSTNPIKTSTLSSESYNENYSFNAAYPELRRQTELTKTVQSVLMDKTAPHLLRHFGNDDDEEIDIVSHRVQVRYAHGFVNLALLLFESIFNFIGAFLVSILLFFLIPKNLANVCENIGTYEGDCPAHLKAATWTFYIFCFLLFLFLLTDFLPRYKKLPGFNSLKDRRPVIARIFENFKIDKVIMVSVYRITSCSVLFSLSNIFEREKLALQWTCFALCVYFFVIAMIVEILNFFSESFSPINVPVSYINYGPETPPIHIIECTKRNKDNKEEVVYPFYCIFKAVFLLLSALLFLIFGGGIVAKILVCGFLFPFIAAYQFYAFRFFKDDLLNDNHFFYMLLGFLEMFFLLMICVDPAMNELMAILIYAISLTQFLLAEIALLVMMKTKKSQEHKKVSEKEQIHKMDKTNYCLVFALAVIFIAILLNIVITEIDVRKTGNFFKSDTILATVEWCSDLAKSFKDNFANLDLTEGGIIPKVAITSIFSPSVICAVIVVYYIITDRHAEMKREYVLSFACIFYGLVFASNVFFIIFAHINDKQFMWDGVAVTTIELKEVTKVSNRIDACLLGVTIMFCALMICDHDINVEDGKKAFNNKHEDKGSGCEKKLVKILANIFRKAFSVIFCLYIIINALIYMGNGEQDLITVVAKKFDNPLYKFESVEENCPAEITQAVANMVGGIKAQLNVVYNYASGTQPQVVLKGTSFKLLMVVPVTVAASSQLVASVFYSDYSEVGGILMVFAMSVAIPCVLFGSLIFMVVYFSTFALVYPFNDVLVSDSFSQAVFLNVIGFLPVVVGYIEKRFVPLSPRGYETY